MLTQWLNGLRAKLRKAVCPMDQVCNCVPLGSSVGDRGGVEAPEGACGGDDLKG